MAFDNGAKKVTLMGHSFIRRLETYMNYDNANLRLSSDLFSIECRARGGLTMQQMAQDRTFTQFHEVPDTCFIHIGENELSRGSVSVDDLAKHIAAFASFLIDGVGVSHVIIGQLLRRQPWTSVPDFNEKVCQVNAILSDRLANIPNVSFWRHRGFWQTLDFLAPDGVHLQCTPQNTRYMNKYLQSVKSAILHVSN